MNGKFTATAGNQTRGAATTFIVVIGKNNSPPLLCRNALFELGMFDIRPDGSLKETNKLRRTDALAIKSVVDSKVNSDIEKILKQHDKVFNGIVKIFDVKNNEDFLVKFSMSPDAAPVAQKPRPVPYYLQEPLPKWLDECVKEDIFEKVESGDLITWCSPLVVQPKPRYKNVSKDT